MSIVAVVTSRESFDGRKVKNGSQSQPVLISVTEENLHNSPLNFPSVGDVKRLLLKLRKMQPENQHIV